MSNTPFMTSAQQDMIGEYPKGICRILSLDGGGAKAFYTLGVLREVEAILPSSINESFDLIFGTSTGSIIAALLSLGRSVDEIHELYRKHVPTIMRARGAHAKTTALQAAGREIFGDARFNEVRIGLGIVSTKWRQGTPMIFKSSHTQAHGRRATFVPGFGCTIADAVEASCSAYPYFKRKVVETSNGDEIELFDGGYCANNPTLYALVDAIAALKYAPKDCRVLSIGCGQYPYPRYRFFNFMKRLCSLRLVEKTLDVNTASMDQLRQLLFPTVPTVRVSGTFERPEMATDMFEHDLKKLSHLRVRGSESFALHEDQIRQLLFDGEQ